MTIKCVHKSNMNANNDNREKKEDRPLHYTELTDADFTEEELESAKAFVLKELKNHADAIEKTARENKGYFTGEMSGIEFNPDYNYHREYLPDDGFVLWVPDDPVHKLFGCPTGKALFPFPCVRTASLQWKQRPIPNRCFHCLCLP